MQSQSLTMSGSAKRGVSDGSTDALADVGGADEWSGADQFAE
jgi:hypothetical protein